MSFLHIIRVMLKIVAPLAPMRLVCRLFVVSSPPFARPRPCPPPCCRLPASRLPAPFRSYGGSPSYAAASRLRRSCRRMIRYAHDSAAIGGRRRRLLAASPSHRPRPSHGAPRHTFYHRDRRAPEAMPSTLLPSPSLAASPPSPHRLPSLLRYGWQPMGLLRPNDSLRS